MSFEKAYHIPETSLQNCADPQQSCGVALRHPIYTYSIRCDAPTPPLAPSPSAGGLRSGLGDPLPILGVRNATRKFLDGWDAAVGLTRGSQTLKIWYNITADKIFTKKQKQQNRQRNGKLKV